MSRYLFNILAHESPECIDDQILNFARFNRGCLIVLHLHPWLGNYKPIDVKEYDVEVIVNPNRFDLQWCKSLVHGWLSNFEYCKHESFTSVELHCSNDLFIKPDRQYYNVESPYSAKVKVCDPVTYSTWPVLRTISGQIEWNAILNHFNFETGLISDVAGEHFSKELFTDIADFYNSFCPNYTPMCAFEEVFFPTVAKGLGYTATKETMRMYDTVNVATIADVEECRSDPTVFSMRRFVRQYDHPTRAYVRSIACN